MYPQDLQQILDNATEGVIYFSLGSNVKSVNLDETLRNIIVEALSELPYKVLWKWESDYLPGRPKNVVTRKWFPQQDLLGLSLLTDFFILINGCSTSKYSCLFYTRGSSIY